MSQKAGPVNCVGSSCAGDADAPVAGGRKRQNMSAAEEREFLAPFMESAAVGGVLVVGQIKAALEKQLGREVALASVYNLLQRNNWRKLAPKSVIRKVTRRLRMSEIKLPETLTEIRQGWAQGRIAGLRFPTVQTFNFPPIRPPNSS